MANNEYGDRFDRYGQTEDVYDDYEGEYIDDEFEKEEFIQYELREEVEEDYEEERPFDHYEKNIQSGEFKVTEARRHPILTIAFFPVAFLFFEIVLRIAIGFKFFDGLLYVIVFSLALGLLFTLLSTISKKAIANRRIARILLIIVTLNYEIQLVYFTIKKQLIDLSSIKSMSLFEVNSSYSSFLDAVNDKLVYLVIFLVPIIVLCICGKFFFPFARTGWGYKIMAIALIVAICLLSIVIIGGSDSKTKSSDSAIVTSNNATEKTQRFGLITSQIMDVYKEIAPESKLKGFSLPKIG